MTKMEKKKILLSFEKNNFLDFRKLLFQQGISVQEFFAHICDSIVSKDADLDSLFRQIKQKKLAKIEKGEKTRLGDDDFYEMFEERLIRDK